MATLTTYTWLKRGLHTVGQKKISKTLSFFPPKNLFLLLLTDIAFAHQPNVHFRQIEYINFI